MTRLFMVIMVLVLTACGGVDKFDSKNGAETDTDGDFVEIGNQCRDIHGEFSIQIDRTILIDNSDEVIREYDPNDSNCYWDYHIWHCVSKAAAKKGLFWTIFKEGEHDRSQTKTDMNYYDLPEGHPFLSECADLRIMVGHGCAFNLTYGFDRFEIQKVAQNSCETWNPVSE